MSDDSIFEDLDFIQPINLIPEYIFPNTYPLHWHIYIEILFLSSEVSDDFSASVSINQKIYTIHRNDILIIWPGELHEILQNESRHVCGIQFSPSLLQARPEFSNYYSSFRKYHHIKADDVPDTASSMNLALDRVVFYYGTNGYFRNLHMTICIYQCFMAYGIYLEHLQSTSHSPSPNISKETAKRIHEACAYISKNCTKPLTLAQVATHTGFSVYYFSRLFKQATNSSFTEYVSLQRIRYAGQLLSDSSQSITEIAFQAGFKSISSFNRVFKQYKGYSPREFRSYFRNK